MARNQQPMTNDEIAAMHKKMDTQTEDIRAVLSENLGEEPDDYRVDQPLTDGGESATHH